MKYCLTLFESRLGEHPGSQQYPEPRRRVQQQHNHGRAARCVRGAWVEQADAFTVNREFAEVFVPACPAEQTNAIYVFSKPLTPSSFARGTLISSSSGRGPGIRGIRGCQIAPTG